MVACYFLLLELTFAEQLKSIGKEYDNIILRKLTGKEYHNIITGKTIFCVIFATLHPLLLSAWSFSNSTAWTFLFTVTSATSIWSPQKHNVFQAVEQYMLWCCNMLLDARFACTKYITRTTVARQTLLQVINSC